MCVHYTKLFLLAMLLCWVGVARPAAAQDDCTTLVKPRLGAGITARVAFNDGIGVVFRDAPTSSNSAVLGNLPEGYILTITGDAPICQDQFLWWAARLPDGQEGFVAEGAGSGYFLEPWEVGAAVFIPAEGQLNHFFVDTRGNVQSRAPLPIAAPIGTAATLWQPFELELAAAQVAACPDQAELFGAAAVGDVPFLNVAPAFYPAPDGTKALLRRDFLLDLPDCIGATQKYGTSTVALTTTSGETLVFPFSQHADPPESQHCQPQTGLDLDHLTWISEVAWSQDGRYVALSVRYLRNSENFPCAFYHVFVVETNTLSVSYAGEGRRVGWGQGGRRLRYLRLERSDPNADGTPRLFSVLPDGGDAVEVFLPGGATWLPGAMDLENAVLPWSENGDKLLACNGLVYTCGEAISFRVVDSGFEGVPIITPDAAQLGNGLRAVYFVAGDTRLLWHTTDGRLFLQPLGGADAGRWAEVAAELSSETPIVDVILVQTGVGAVLRLDDGRRFYLDVLGGTVSPITGL